MPESSNHSTGVKPMSGLEFDVDFTENVINATGPKADPRMRQVMSAFIRHIHDFAREVNLTTEEWMAAVNMINWAGKMSTDRRNEGQLMCDVIGLESLVDEITYKLAAESTKGVTASAILGPFWRHDAPLRENGSSIVHDVKDGEICWMHGKVLDGATGRPIPNAEIDVWEASTNGLYEQQDDNQVDHNLRGKFRTTSEGTYDFYCLRPTPYPIPGDGPAGKLLDLLDRHHYRPAHIHLIVVHDDYKPVTTQIFDKNGKFLEDDAVFAVKDSLVVDFVPLTGNSKATLELAYDITLIPRN